MLPSRCGACDETPGWRAVIDPVTDHTFTITAHAKARGWDAAFGAGVVRVKEGQSGRGERSQTSTTDLNVPVRLLLEIEVTGAEPWLRNSSA